MKKHVVLACAVIAFLPGAAGAQQQDAVAALADDLKAHAPATWEIRVRWRDGQLLASITPWPYQQAFDLWYDISKLSDTLRGLCPDRSGKVWALIASNQDIVLEPTVGGKSVVEARVNCRATRSNQL